MAKKNYKKYLPKVGGTAAVALAMTVALSSQAHAAEIDEIDSQSVGSTPPVDSSTESNTPVDNTVVEPAEANQAIEEANEDIVAENNEIVESNEQTEQNNDDAAQNNEESTGGELTDPELDLSDAPEFTGDDDMNTDEYNDAVDD